MSRKLTVTYMIDVLDTDLAGTENQLIKLINGLDKNRFRVRLLCLSDHPWFRANVATLACDAKTFNIRRFKRVGTYVDFVNLIHTLRQDRPDIVHTFFPVSNIVGVLAARIAGVKTIISSRRDYGEWMTPTYLAATRFANRFVTAVVANSRPVGDLTRQREAVNNGRLQVIPNGLDLTQFNGLAPDLAIKKRLTISENTKVIGLVANFRPMKHHDTLVRAAKAILKVRDDVTFLLVGDGPLERQTKALSRSLGVRHHFVFAGSQKEVRPYLSIMDIGVNCSEAEGLSNAIMEYMAAGIPCIVSRAGGNPDLIDDNINGYTFELGDDEALASLVIKLLDDQQTRERFIRNSREMIRSEMSLDHMLSAHQSLYQRLADGRP